MNRMEENKEPRVDIVENISITENTIIKEKSKISTPIAIIIAGILIMIGIVYARGEGTPKVKTFSEQVGVSKDALNACIKATDLDATDKAITASVDKAMSAYAPNERGTPYSIVIGANGVMTDVRGAESYQNMKKIIDDALAGKVTTVYKGSVALSEPTDHVQGSANPKVTIIEYSDFECPYCKQFHPTLEQLMKDYSGNIKWIYRHYPLHQHSFERLVAANCVAQLKGEDAFWKYGDLLFTLVKTSDDDNSSAQL